MRKEKGYGTPGASWRPSNGTEGYQFERTHCDVCEQSRETKESEAKTGEPKNPCQIQGNAWFNEKDEPDYPKEWQYDADGWPTCTAFERIGT